MSDVPYIEQPTSDVDPSSVFTPEQISAILELAFATFGHKQYVGARYVPILGRKGESSIDWDNSEPYEPLTIVLHEGNSYTSRQFVPKGIDILNQEYWANTGNYNAQVEQYRQEVLAFDGRITKNENDIAKNTKDIAKNTQDIAANKQNISTNTQNIATNTQNISKNTDDIAQLSSDDAGKNIMLIGDSYSVQNGDVTGWIAPITKYLQANKYKVFSKGMGGYGFGRPSTAFTSLVEQLLETMSESDKTQTSLVIIAGGYNDNPYTLTDITSGMSECLNVIKANLPNAKLKIAFIGAAKPSVGTRGKLIDTYNNYLLAANSLGIETAPKSSNWIYNGSTEDVFMSDGFHPNNKGLDNLVSSIGQWIVGGSFVYIGGMAITVNLNSGFTKTSGNIFLYNHADDELEFDVGTITLDRSTVGTGKTLNIGTLNIIPTLWRGFVKGNVNVKSASGKWLKGVCTGTVNYETGVITLDFNVINEMDSNFDTTFVQADFLK